MNNQRDTNQRFTKILRVRIEEAMETNLEKLGKSNGTDKSHEARQAIKDRIKRSGIK